MSYFSIENFKLQKTLFQTSELKEEDVRQQQIDGIYKNLSELQVQLFLTAIESVQVDGALVTEKAYIEEWLRNTERESYQLIKQKLEENKAVWDMPPQRVACGHCAAENIINVTLDQASFFA